MHESKKKQPVETALKHDAVSPCTKHKVVNIAHPPTWESAHRNHPGKQPTEFSQILGAA